MPHFISSLLRAAILSLVLVLFLPLPHQGQPPYNRQYVTVAGKKMSYKSFGLNTRLPGNPVLIFEAGYGVGGAINFTSLFPALSKTASGLGYDRNGEGESEQDTTVMTSRDRAQRLHAFLQVAHVKPPYILIGHSMGGSIIRMFTSLYPAEVAGLVFIDPADFMQSKKQHEALRLAIHLDQDDSISAVRRLERMAADTMLPTLPRHRARQQLRELDRNRDLREFDSLAPLPDIPMAVLLTYNSPRPTPRDTAAARQMPTKAVMEMMNHFRIENYQALLENSDSGYIMLLPKYQHFVHEQNPALVVTVIEGIYQKALEGLKGSNEK
ncbi:MAG TPA: alpha/beta hydrolase [Puia sp.]|nr:alpha/beta hydrolase [Puia sp.]